jgi:Fe-S cluster biogenesis protein NfuA
MTTVNMAVPESRACANFLGVLTREPYVGYLELLAKYKEKSVDKEISIVGEPTVNPAACSFTIDRPVYAGGSAYFKSRESAEHSPLARKIFEIPEVENVLIAENQVTVTKAGFDPWPAIGKQVGAKIREHIRSREPAVDAEFDSTLPPEAEIRVRVKDLFEQEINPALGSHGGWVELIDVRRNSVYLKLGGGCQGCGSAKMTLKMGIERVIRERIPEVGEILDTTDHAAGRNPYFQQ